MQPGDGIFDIIYGPDGIDECYILTFTHDHFVLGRKEHDDSMFEEIAMSTTSTSGPWTIALTNTIAIGISNGDFPFIDEAQFCFWIKTIPDSVQNKLTSQ